MAGGRALRFTLFQVGVAIDNSSYTNIMLQKCGKDKERGREVGTKRNREQELGMKAG